jgi:hypothetical protein
MRACMGMKTFANVCFKNDEDDIPTNIFQLCLMFVLHYVADFGVRSWHRVNLVNYRLKFHMT